VLGSRYLKSGESIKTRKKCQFPYSYSFANLYADVEPKHTSGEALDHTGLKTGENTSEKKNDKSKSPKFVSPLFNGM
jgi:hypothetical protein